MITPEDKSTDNISTEISIADNLVPIIPLKDVVIFPNMVVPLFVGRQKSINALEVADKKDKQVILLSQKNPADNDVNPENLHLTGTLAKILQILPLPDGTKKVLIEGKTRAKAKLIVDSNGFLAAEVEEIKTKQDINKIELEAQRREIIQLFDEFAKLNQKVPDEVVSIIAKISNIEQLADVIITHVIVDLAVRQELLETASLKKRLALLLRELNREIEILNVERKIQGRVKQQIEKNQKEYYLHEQQRAIQNELGEGEEQNEIQELESKISKAKMSEDAEKKAYAELKKLKLMPQMSSESALIRNYIEHLTDLPWNKTTKVSSDLEKAQKTLDKDHYGLDKVKERIIEYLAVQRRAENNKAPILCFVGPPGVGKTSLGESIAKATNRKYVRIALGGLHDEAEIRGHRKTYIGAMAGKVLQNISKSGVKNPLVLFDEIDKIGADHRGDPAAALLEVLDPEQNKAFVDNYTEVAFDLSQVMFLCTSNSMNIPGPLRDRMEIIRLSGYTELEKLKIAEQYLLPRQIKNSGLKNSEISIEPATILDVIRYHTAEAGVRNLDRQIAKLCRKVVTQIDTKKTTAKKIKITPANLGDFLGVQTNDFGISAVENRIGRVTGLAWTEVGGDILTIEVVAIPGKGVVIRSGQLGDVMKESIQAAITVVRSRCVALGIDEKFYENKDIHIHVPDGATPKDGPSAGIAMVTAIASSLNHVPIKSSVAMTGEVTLYGEVLPIGGLKEKMLAALRAGIKTVLIPEKNTKDLDDIPDEIKGQLEIIPVKTIDQVLDIALEYKPILLEKTIKLTDDELVSSKSKTPAAGVNA
ncbi:MAG: endopeptidase La [Burkholderiales bacterium]|nr:endopeptidase La [Burkholderiales bacterium]MBP9768560.1 endopeptidase La [Burkholderiales bacterium]